MSSIPELQVLPEVKADRRATPKRAYCQLDHWGFDPRYTGGVCPICGWMPDGAPSAPAWIRVLKKLDWEIPGLLVLIIALIVLGGVVAYAAELAPGLRLTH